MIAAAPELRAARPLPARLSPTASWAEASAVLGLAVPSVRLSPAEQVVAAFLARGLSNREIAVALGKSEATVKRQVSACLEKCGVPTRGRLIAALGRIDRDTQHHARFAAVPGDCAI